jgi:hypothetical protein
MFHILSQTEDRPASVEVDRTRLSAIADNERRALFKSLATTINRALYHQKRFGFFLAQYHERRERTGCTRGYDEVSRLAGFEALSVLSTVRSAVDELVFITARRHGESGRDDDGWKVHPLLTSSNSTKETEELRYLRAQVDWFKELNDYRNALVHRGFFFPSNDPAASARIPDADNPWLAPDRRSITNHARPHLWTFVDRVAMEDLLTRVCSGFHASLHVLGRMWGLSSPPPAGTAPVEQHPNIVIATEQPAFVLGREDTIHVAVFTAKAKADEFIRALAPDTPIGPVVPIRPCRLAPPDRYYLSIPSGELLRRTQGVPMTGWVKFAVDPSCDPNTKALDYRHELGNVPLETLLTHPLDSMLFEFPAEGLSPQQLFVIRR